MNNIDMLIRMSPSTNNTGPALILPPIRQNMVYTSAAQTRATDIQPYQLHFSQEVIPHVPPPLPPGPITVVPNVQLDGTMIGPTVQVSLIIFSIITVFSYV
jgi:hypothetical protein